MNIDTTTTSVDTTAVDKGGATSTTTISDLPQPLLIHIHSFLTLPEAIQASFVCRNFHNLWHSVPSLHFDISDYYTRSTLSHPRSDYSRQVFADFISQTLNFRQLNPLTKLHFTFEYTNFGVHKFNVQSWIRHAVNLSVLELILDFRDEDKFDSWDDPDNDIEDEGHRLCTFFFHLLDIARSCINVLKLYSCLLLLPPKTNPIKFASLKSLHLEAIINGRDKVGDLLARCVNLEILKLVRMDFNMGFSTKRLEIHSSTLRELDLYLCSKWVGDRPFDLDICCPSLQKFSLLHSEFTNYINKDATMLVEAWIDSMPLFDEENYNQSWEKMLCFFTNISSLQVWDEIIKQSCDCGHCFRQIFKHSSLLIEISNKNYQLLSLICDRLIANVSQCCKLLESNEVPAGCEQFASNVKHLEIYCSYDEIDLVGLAALLKLLPKLEILGLTSRSTIDEDLDRDYRKASTVFNMPCLRKVILRMYHKTKRERHFIKLFKKSGIVLDKIELLCSSDWANDSKY